MSHNSICPFSISMCCWSLVYLWTDGGNSNIKVDQKGLTKINNMNGTALKLFNGVGGRPFVNHTNHHILCKLLFETLFARIQFFPFRSHITHTKWFKQDEKTTTIFQRDMINSILRTISSYCVFRSLLWLRQYVCVCVCNYSNCYIFEEETKKFV